MALSEHEQRLLDEMERSLYQNDADIVAPGRAGGRVSYASLVIGILVAIAGLALVIVGVVSQLPILGIAGFVVMFAGVLIATRRSAPSDDDGTAEQLRTPSGSDGKRGRSFMAVLEERWERRRDERD